MVSVNHIPSEVLRVFPFYRRFLPNVAEWLNEPDIGKLMNVEGVMTASCLLEAWRTSRKNPEIRTVIFVYNQTPIGQGFLFDFNGDSCELGWYLSSKYRYIGLGYLSHKLLLSYAFQLLKVVVVRAVVSHGNVSSENVITKLGYIKVGESDRGAVYQINSSSVSF